MLKIGLLSDTHAWWDDKYAEYFSECDEIWHAGDIGSDGLAARLAALKPFRAVYGNIDGQSLRLQYPQVAHFKAEEVNVMMTHIAAIRDVTIRLSEKSCMTPGPICSLPDIRIS